MKSLIAFIATISVVVIACARKDSPSDATPIDPPYGCVSLVSVTPASAILHVGDTLTLHNIGSPSCRPSRPNDWHWLSSDTLVAVVDSASGLVRAKHIDVASIISIATEDANVKGAAAITVIP